MALSLIVEDGTGTNPAANSYATVDQVKAYLDQRGIAYPAAGDTIVTLITEAMDFLETYDRRFKGERALPLTQPLSWPRRGVVYRGAEVPTNYMPRELVAAVAVLTGIAASGVDLMPVTSERAVTKEVIGPIEIDYSATAGASITIIAPQIDAVLGPIMNAYAMLTVERA